MSKNIECIAIKYREKTRKHKAMSSFDSLSVPLKRIIGSYIDDTKFEHLGQSEAKTLETLVMFEFDLEKKDYHLGDTLGWQQFTVQDYIAGDFLYDFKCNYPDYNHVYRWLLNTYPSFMDICGKWIRNDISEMTTRRNRKTLPKGKRYIIKMYIASEWPLEKFVRFMIDSANTIRTKNPLKKNVCTRLLTEYLQRETPRLLKEYNK